MRSWLLPGRAAADAIVVTKAMKADTIAEVFVESSSVRVEMEIGPPDIGVFRNLLPDEVYRKFGFEDDDSEALRLQDFFQNELVITGEDALPLTGRLVGIGARRRILRDEVTGKPLDVQPENAPVVVYAELQYDLPGQPDSISIRPPIDQDSGNVKANIGFVNLPSETARDGIPLPVTGGVPGFKLAGSVVFAVSESKFEAAV